MSHILTLEQISDIDTFTLEEKIQELEKHVNAPLFTQLIAIAKLELDERLKIEEFGRMLLNYEIPLEDDFLSRFSIKVPERIEKIEKVQEVSVKNLGKGSQRKINYSECLRKSLVNDDNAILVGKPAIGNYKYVEKKPSSTVKMKKSSVREIGKTYSSKLKQVPVKKNSIVNNPVLMGSSSKLLTDRELPKTITSKPERNSEFFISESIPTTLNPTLSSTISIEELPTIVQIPESSLLKSNEQTFEHKREQSKMVIKYIENEDVYEGEKMILEKVQKLADFEVEASIVVEIEQCENNLETESIKENLSLKEKVEEHDQSVLEEENREINETICTEISVENEDRHNVFDGTKIKELIFKRHISEAQETSTLNPTNEFDPEPYPQEVEESCNLEKKETITPINNENISTPLQSKKQKQESTVFIKARSVSQIDKSKTLRTSEQKFGKEKDNAVIATAKMSMVGSAKMQALNKTSVNFIRVNKFESQVKRVIPIMTCPVESNSDIFRYHEIISSFNKLFSHSENLLIDLREIEKQLKDHLSKKATQISLSDEYLKIRESELHFKAISESEKANKYRNLFDINIETFISRNLSLINRINKENKVPTESNILLYRVIRQKEDVYDIINNSFHRTDNWYELPHGMDLKNSYNLIWTWSKPQICLKELFYFQKVNHFFGNKEISRKDLLKKNIEKIKKLGAKAHSSFDIIPETYFLPGENMQFVRKFRECSSKSDLNYWIMKPVGMSRGRGIELVNKIEDIVFNEPVVIQKYLSNPLLLDGHKFDMRIYVLVTSINPLEAYVYKEGFARLSTQRYSLDGGDINNKFIHLTNFSVQKENLECDGPKIDQNYAMNSLEKQMGGCKITLRMLREKLSKQGISWQKIESQIDSIVVKSLVSVMNSIPQNPNCFELFGYDIMIDQNLKCWLIEVNSSPSLEKEYPIDEIVKQQLVDDIISIVDPLPYDRDRLLEVVSRRRKELEGLKSHINTNNNSSMQLDLDLHYILHGRKMKRYGEWNINENFRRVAPGDVYSGIVKTVQQYKISTVAKEE